MSFYVPAGFTASKVSNAGDVPDPPRHPARHLKSAGHHQFAPEPLFLATSGDFYMAIDTRDPVVPGRPRYCVSSLRCSAVHLVRQGQLPLLAMRPERGDQAISFSSRVGGAGEAIEDPGRTASDTPAEMLSPSPFGARRTDSTRSLWLDRGCSARCCTNEGRHRVADCTP